MAESASSLMNRGLISFKALKNSRSKAQKSKMANFNSKDKDDGRGKPGPRSATSSRHINTYQEKGSAIASAPTKRGGMKEGGEPKSGHINAGKKSAPSGSKAYAHGDNDVKGGVRPRSSGPQYGGPASRANG